MDLILRAIEAVKNLPLRFLTGLALAGSLILALPHLSGMDLGTLSREWLPYVWATTIVAWCCTLTSVVAKLWSQWATHPAYYFQPLPVLCWWHNITQQSGEVHSQLCADIMVSNLSDKPLRVVAARLASPRIPYEETTHASVSLFPLDGGFASHLAQIAPHGTDRIRVEIMARRLVGKPRKVLRTKMMLTLDPPATVRLRIRFTPRP